MMWSLVYWIIFTLYGQCNCHTIDVSNIHADGESVTVLTNGVLIASITVAVCGVVILVMCLDICQRHSGFKDFDNDAFTDDSLPPVHMPVSEFTMYPPIENTPDTVSATSPVVFEPLPDLTAETRRKVGNAWRLRPKLVHEGKTRSDSTDSLDQVTRNDSVQMKLKLQNLITSGRHQVPRGQLQYIKELGNGWFGKVLQGQGHDILPGHKKTKVVIQMLKEETDVQEQLAFLEEVISYRDTDHANVLKLLGQCVDTEPYLNVLELCPFGDLKTYLRSHRVAMESFNEKGLLLKFACDMAAGLQALHQEGFIHRDFATRNCLLASDLSVKVGDYGISEEVFKEDYYLDRNGDAVPIRWLAPECVHVTVDDVYVKKITKEANVWTYGISLWEVITFGALPYSDLSNSHILRLVIAEKTVKLRKPDVPVSNLDRLYQLLELCWSEPEFRPSLRELRIMLLHLLSRRDDQNTAAFDLKWNQLMPRRSPRVTRAKPKPPGNLSQPNGAVRSITGLDLQEGAGSPPSFLSGHDMSFSEPSPSDSIFGKPQQLTTPINELSLEAEFSAVNVAAVSENLENNGFARDHSEEQLVSSDNALSPIKLDKQGIESDLDRKPNENITSEPPEGMPDVVVNSTQSVNQNSADFMTSTPNKYEDGGEIEFSGSGLGVSTSQMMTDGSQTTGTYHTAHSEYSSQSSTERSLSMEYEDRSFMGTKKFADLLQTVAMTTSIDDDTSSEASPMPLDLTEEEVFKSMASPGIYTSDIQPIGKNELGEFVSGSGEDTPRNTPTPPFTQNVEPLANAGEATNAILDTSESGDNGSHTSESVKQSTPHAVEKSSHGGEEAVEHSMAEDHISESAE